ncbi:MAG: hypothetical protein E5W83_12515 [Mesorhizobium sp.]|nr:MAG: hypothetical protein E5W83_12515 [Mesorhizobium sp.]
MVLLWCFVILAVAPFWQTRWGVIPDTSWIITVCERILGGDRLYVDLIETNPPFTVWLYLPAVYLANVLGIAPEYLVHGYSYAVCVFALRFAGFVAHRARFAENSELYTLLPVFLALLVLFPGNSFSERENLGVALLLPLLVLMAWRASGDRSSEPDWRLAALAGLSGSVVVLVKPYYAVMILAPALYVAWRERSIRPLFAIEYWLAGIACLTYLIATLWLYPEFMRDIYPKLAGTYMRHKQYAPVFFIVGIYLIPFITLLLLRTGRALSPLVVVLAIASVAGLVPLIYQAKGWSYHAYPAIVLVLAAMLCRVTERSSAGTQLTIVQKILLAAVLAVSWLPFRYTQKPEPDFVASIRAAVDHPTIGLIGSGIESGHPLTRMIEGRWISVHCSDWLGSFAAAFAQKERVQGNTIDAARLEALERGFLDSKLRELETAKPDLILIQKSDTFWVPHVMKRSDFANFMKGYRPLAEDQIIRVYLRNGSEKITRPTSAPRPFGRARDAAAL